MNPHNLPPIPSLDQLPAPGITATNPGLVCPADQAYPAVRSDADQTLIPSTHAKMAPPDIAVSLPTSINVQADTRISGGLPICVHIR